MKKLRVAPAKLGNLLENLSFIDDGPRFNSCVSTCLDWNLKPRVERTVCFLKNNGELENVMSTTHHNHVYGSVRYSLVHLNEETKMRSVLESGLKLAV